MMQDPQREQKSAEDDRIERAVAAVSPFSESAPPDEELAAQGLVEDWTEKLQRSALSDCLNRAKKRRLDLSTERYIIFADQHRGARDRADDFLAVEQSYNAALEYYFRKGYTLVVLGDCEDLWEEKPSTVLAAYRHTFELEAKFHREGRYIRVYGNHDLEWTRKGSKRLLDAAYGTDRQGPEGGVPLYESLVIHVFDRDQRLGALFLAHGHQGTLDADIFHRWARSIVRSVWAPFQRLTHLSVNPSEPTSWRAREMHDEQIYSWVEAENQRREAKGQGRLILISGHTHRPVFLSRQYADKVARIRDKVEQRLARNPTDKRLLERAAVLGAKLEWINTLSVGKRNRALRPLYFNPGCCCYQDGDITGLDISNGWIRLVRWPDNQGEPRPCLLDRARLRQVFTEQ